jgi:RNA polymerase sigma-70 factor (ECF subfamily)
VTAQNPVVAFHASGAADRSAVSLACRSPAEVGGSRSASVSGSWTPGTAGTYRRRRTAAADDDAGVSDLPAPVDQGPALLALYDRAVPEVYGYLLRRCGGPTEAADLTAETFLAAAAAVRAGTVERLTVAWLIGVARHKLVDHYRRRAREERNLAAVADEHVDAEDPWDAHLDAAVAHEVLGRLGAHHRAALTLRYLDDLPVPQVADHLGRTLHATEALLVRARLAFRRAYDEEVAP